MGAAIPLREDYDAASLRVLRSRAGMGRIVGAAYDGHRRSGACGGPMIRDWVLRRKGRRA